LMCVRVWQRGTDDLCFCFWRMYVASKREGKVYLC